LQHHNEIIGFNKGRVRVLMDNDKFFRNLSVRGMKVPDKYKHVVLSE